MDVKNRWAISELSGLRSRVRPGFLLSFSVAGLLGVALLVLVLSRAIGGEIRSDEVTSATNSVELLATASFAPHLQTGQRLDVADLGALDRVSLAARRTAGVSGIIIVTRAGRIAYSTDHRRIGQRPSRPSGLTDALGGQTVTRVGRSGNGTEQISVMVPIYRARGASPSDVVRVAVPYAPVAEAVSTRTHRITYILIGVSLLFYALLWPMLLRASRAVRVQSDPRRLALIRELANGIKHEQLLLHYQPTIDLIEGRVVAVEALLRWQHPKRGLLVPSEFLPTLTDEALNSQLTLHVVAMALRDCQAWRDRGIDAAVNVNLSVANVLDASLPDQIGTMLAAGGIPPNVLGLEITESAIVADEQKATAMLTALDGMGVRLAIDDFGTGYSSLTCLRDLPISELKIDRGFIVGLRTRPRDKAIVRLISALAHGLDVKVVAEGVEDEATVDELAALQVDMAQGYYFSRPLPLAELVAWFEAPVIAGRAPATTPALAPI